MTTQAGRQPNPGQPRPVVAQIHHAFFERSETFIHHALTAMRSVQPILLSRFFLNLESFPFPDGDRYALSSARHTPAWLAEALARRLTGREIRAEKILRRRQARLMHAHFGHNGVWALRMKRVLDLPLVTTFYGHDMSQAASLAAWGKSYRQLFKEGDLILVEGPHMKQRLSAIGCPAEKIAVQRISIPLAGLPFRPRPAKGKKEKVIILFVGRLIEKKGLRIALAALSEVRHAHPDFEFRIIGDGPLRPEIEDFIQARAMDGYVRLLGSLDYGGYLEEMQNADLFLQPSVTAADGDSEGGAPTTILEAQAMGLPVLSSRHADVPYIVDPGRSALLSGEGDIAELAVNVNRLLEDRECWSVMGAAGRCHVEAYHDVAREIPRLESIYAGLIRSGSR